LALKSKSKFSGPQLRHHISKFNIKSDINDNIEYNSNYNNKSNIENNEYPFLENNIDETNNKLNNLNNIGKDYNNINQA